MSTTVKYIKKSNFLDGQPKFKGQSGYPFSKVVLVPIRNQFDSCYLTGLTLEDEKFYEKSLGYAEGVLKNTSEFWCDFTAELQSGKLVLEDENLLDQMRLKFINQLSNVAKSLKEARESSLADFVIIDEEKEVTINVSAREIRDKAIVFSSKLSEDDLSNYLSLKGIATKSLSSAKIKDLAFTDRDNNPAKFLNTFSDKNYKIKIFISELVQNKILSIRGTGYLHVAQNEMIGSTIDQVIEFVQDPKNQNIIAAFKQEMIKK